MKNRAKKEDIQFLSATDKTIEKIIDDSNVVVNHMILPKGAACLTATPTPTLYDYCEWKHVQFRVD